MTREELIYLLGDIDGYFSQYTGPLIDEAVRKALEHVVNATIHVTTTDKVRWDEKVGQNELSTVRRELDGFQDQVLQLTYNLNSRLDNTLSKSGGQCNEGASYTLYSGNYSFTFDDERATWSHLGIDGVDTLSITADGITARNQSDDKGLSISSSEVQVGNHKLTEKISGPLKTVGNQSIQGSGNINVPFQSYNTNEHNAMLAGTIGIDFTVLAWGYQTVNPYKQPLYMNKGDQLKVVFDGDTSALDPNAPDKLAISFTEDIDISEIEGYDDDYWITCDRDTNYVYIAAYLLRGRDAIRCKFFIRRS